MQTPPTFIPTGCFDDYYVRWLEIRTARRNRSTHSTHTHKEPIMQVVYADGTRKSAEELKVDALRSLLFLARGNARISGNWARVEQLEQRLQDAEEDMYDAMYKRGEISER